jgi:hypothetical protein
VTKALSRLVTFHVSTSGFSAGVIQGRPAALG